MLSVFTKSMTYKVTKLLVTYFMLFGLVAPATSHTYFFGVSDLNINKKSQGIEIIHQFTAHDIENAIAEIKQVHFSPEHNQYDIFIQEYFEQGFELTSKNKTIKLNWLGFEVKSGKLIAYQEVIKRDSRKYLLSEIVVKNTILVDTYPTQVNTVNFQGKDNQGKDFYGSLTFDKRIKVAKIIADTKAEK